jgi:hypothetical protein
MGNLSELIKKYEAHRETCLKADYNETQLRIDFLDPFFEILGWDINNKQGKPTNEREVLLEEGLKADATSNTKKPDYTFRLFAERKFFLEAKKPYVKIQDKVSPAKQIRRYGFTGKLKISVLSNFEYLAIYDCSKEVEEEDNASTARIALYHYIQYEEAFDEIKRQLSHESVYTGEFNNIWKDIEEQIKFSSVDSLFLKQINEWRLLLGKEIYLHKPDLAKKELNDLVQSYINSIIFLRVCEDRNLETYKTLLNFADHNDFLSLIQKFSDADKKYNAGLFNHPYTEEIITNSASSFWQIIKDLYFPESTYSFSVFSSDILGNIYEVFLGEELKIIDGEIILEKKPENIDRDIVATPPFIVRDILNATVASYCRGKTDEEILSSKFADIACGSGAFLLEVFQLIHDILIDYYLEHNRSILIQTSVNSYKLPYNLKKKILKNCIIGVDKDYNAVQASKFGLLLKLLEDENDTSITSPALPNLDNNILFGNSLIDSKKLSPALKSNEIETINPFDFSQKFDVIVGNPPYMSTEHIKDILPLEKPLYEKYYDTAYKQYDKYFLFIERALTLLKDDGYFGYIVPSKFIKVLAANKLRKIIGERNLIQSLVSFGSEQVFENKTTYTCLLILNNKPKDKFKYIYVDSLQDWKIKNINKNSISYESMDTVQKDNWVLIPPRLKSVHTKILENSMSLSDLVGKENVNNGIQTSKNKLYIHFYSNTTEDANCYYINKDGNIWAIEKELTMPYYQTIRSDNDRFYTYRDVEPNSFVIYPYKLQKDGSISLININTLKKSYKGVYRYFKFHETELKARDFSPEATRDDWYKFGRSQHLSSAICPIKIIAGVLSNGHKYSIDKKNTFISSGGTAGYCMIRTPSKSLYSIYYLQALLSSKYLEWIVFWYGEIFRGNFVARGTKVLERLPIIKINFDNAKEKTLHDMITSTQKGLNDLQAQIDKNFGNNRKIIPLKRKFEQQRSFLDKYLYELYNLGESDKLIPSVTEIYEIN